MKKTVMLLILLLMICSCISVYSEEPTTETESAYETILLKKGTILQKEFQDVDLVVVWVMIQ